LPDFGKERSDLNEKHIIQFSISENPIVQVSRLNLQKSEILYFFQKKDPGC
jgi:hypothetical protein